MKIKAVVIIPIYKETPDKFEIIALQQCLKVLKKHPIRFFAPKGLSLKNYEGFFGESSSTVDVDFFPDTYFKDIDGYNRLCLSKSFYQKYAAFDYMLIYQLDAFVFEDRLPEWCQLNYDYLGGPWFVGYSKKFTNRVGNGGLSLRNVNTALKVLNAKNSLFLPYVIFQLFKDLSLNVIRRYKRDILINSNLSFTSSEDYINSFKYNEDIFWGKVAPIILKEYKTAPPVQAMKFAFDTNPEYLYQMNKEKLPFGCHGWSKPNNLEFWQPFIEKEGYKL